MSLGWLLLSGALMAGEPAKADEGQTIFNGKDLDGWVAEGNKEYKDGDQTKPVWTAEDGLLTCAGKGFGFLRYNKREFADFAFHVEYSMAPKGNTGIGIRTLPYVPAKDEQTRPSISAYEIQLIDDAGKKPSDHGSGSLYRYVAPKANPVKPAPGWNSIDVVCVGPRIRISINGEEIIDVDQTKVEAIKDKPLKGYVCLQNHGSKIQFRNIRIQDKAEK